MLVEPSDFHTNSGGHDVSFLFQVKGDKWQYAIWESLALGKATYLFKFKDLSDCSVGILRFADYLSTNSYQGRMALREQGFAYSPLVDIKHVIHSPQVDNFLEVKEDLPWVNALSLFLK